MVVLTQMMRESVGLDEGASAADFLALGEDASAVLDGLLSSDESRAAALQSLERINDYRIEIFEQGGSVQEKFLELIVADSNLPVLIGFVGSDRLIEPVTGLENLIFWSLLDSDSPLQGTWIEDEGPCYAGWRPFLSGKVLVAFPASIVAESFRRLICALFSIPHVELAGVRAVNGLMGSVSGITLSGDVNRYSPTQARLIFEAVSETNPKWRCLSFYRILENAYLSNIQSILNDSFHFDAKTALTIAQKSVSSEVQQLITLAESLSMQAQFLAFNVAIEDLLTAGNKYIKALDKSASDDRDLYGHREIWRKAVLRFYKLRCSIAHGGTSSVIYEQFSDANSAAITLLPSMERIAYRSLGLELR
ncbi:hypothetical protein ACIOVF_23870 [Pseudomonas sp. NPDC087612]|uniref:hypothetical protein n=1 Tax=Pseudomonas sp. NPDC087612 TaxID=3364441 RepID=UPI0037F67618